MRPNQSGDAFTGATNGTYTLTTPSVDHEIECRGFVCDSADISLNDLEINGIPSDARSTLGDVVGATYQQYSALRVKETDRITKINFSGTQITLIL